MSIAWNERKLESWQQHNVVTMPRKMDDVILARSDDWEHKGQCDPRAMEIYIMLAWSFGLLAVMTMAGYLAYEVIPWIWSNAVWLWNAGPQDEPWYNPARWALATALAMTVFCCFMWARQKWQERLWRIRLAGEEKQ